MIFFPVALVACGDTSDNAVGAFSEDSNGTSETLTSTTPKGDIYSFNASLAASKQDDTSAYAIDTNSNSTGPVTKIDSSGNETSATTTSTVTANADSVDAVETARGATMPAEPDAVVTSPPASSTGSASGNITIGDTSAQTGSSTTVSADTGNAPLIPVSSGLVNSLDTIVDDMALMNDLPLVGVNPAYGFSRGPGFNIMGNNPSGSNLPTWFTDSYPEAAQTGYWKAIIPWFVLFEGQGNAASNVRVQMRNLKLYILSRSTNQWTEIVSEQDVGGEFCPQGSNYHQCTGGDATRAESSGGISIAPLAGNDFHGWYGGRTAIDGADIKAVFVTMQSRLIQDDPLASDDRNVAKYLFDVGADYYPEMGPSSFYLPGVGVSRAKLITNNWQSFNFMTFSDVGEQDPGGGIPEQEFRSNPPPLE